MEGQAARNYSLVVHQGQTFVQHQNVVRPRLQTYYAATPEQPSHQQQPVEAAKVNAHFAETQVSNLQPTETQEINPATIDAEKLAIYKHPLFPLLMQLLEKCEQTTSSVDDTTSSNFDMEIKSFVMQQAKEGKGYLVNEPEIDSLMIKALQVLRIHLLELEKVNELCKDFCSRYIACLRAKLNSENLMRTLNVQPGSPCDEEIIVAAVNQISAEPSEQNNTRQESCSPALLYPQQLQTMPAFQYLDNVKNEPPDQKVTITTTATETPTTGDLPIDFDCEDENMEATVQPVDTPAPGSRKTQRSTSAAEKKALKRGVLPKQATSIMKAWLFQNLVHPYPSEDQKKQIADQCNLKILQVNNWFINARRRILQPMLESSPYGNRNRKLKPQKCPAQRAWPDAIGVITSYPADGNQYQTVATLPDYALMNSNGEQSNTPSGVSMIINVPPNSTTPIQGGATPVQYIQVAGTPTMVHGVAGGSILQVAPTLQPCILTPVDGQPNMSKAVPTAQIVGLPVSVGERQPDGPVSIACVNTTS